MFVLKSSSYGYASFDGYYTGNTYVYQGEVYAVCDTDLSKVKKYSSEKRAANACDALNRKCSNYLFTVVNLKENEEY